jgi:threonine/homoserine/homoserine lactone efflux protein
MNTTALFASIAYWISFGFSPGPFWAAWMTHHAQEGSLAVYKQYIPYLLGVFCVQCFLLALMVQFFGQINANLLVPLYFIGGGYIIYFGIRSFKAAIASKKVDFGFKQMAILGLTNPKVYLTVPIGSLSANYFEVNAIWNSAFFAFIIAAPVVLSGSLFYVLLAKLSTKMLMDKVKYFTSGLLLVYGLYLWFEGLTKLYQIFSG